MQTVLISYTFVCYYRPGYLEHVPVMDQETQENQKFIDLEATGVLLDTLAKNISE